MQLLYLRFNSVGTKFLQFILCDWTAESQNHKKNLKQNGTVIISNVFIDRVEDLNSFQTDFLQIKEAL